MGSTLFGGEKQRPAFARILLHQSDIVVLDQAKSALDPGSQHKLMELLTPSSITIVSVDHRPELEAFHSRKIVLERQRGGARFVTDITLIPRPGRRRLLRRWLRARPAPEKKTTYQWERRSAQGRDRMNTVRLIFIGVLLLPWPAGGQEHRFEADPIVVVRENFVACDVLSQLQRVMGNPRFLLAGECEPLREGDQVRVYARRGPYFCIYPHDRTSPCKWTHEKALSK